MNNYYLNNHDHSTVLRTLNALHIQLAAIKAMTHQTIIITITIISNNNKH